MLRAGFEWYGELGTYVREDYPSRLLCSHIGCIGCELLSNKYGELVTYVRKDYLFCVAWKSHGLHRLRTEFK